nr:methyl-accepting chemotaxis protein [Treponemataceae bacterium]
MKKTNFFDKTITRQLTFSIGALLIVLLGILGVVISTQVNKSFTAINNNYLEQATSYYEESTSKIIETEFNIGATLQTALQDYYLMAPAERRDYINRLLRDTLKQNPSLVDAWTAWEPNALDGLDSKYVNRKNHDSTGRFIPYWTQVEDKIECTPLTDYENGSWYVDPLKSEKGILIDPNLYNVGGKDIWVCGVAFPIKDRNGKAVGVVGLDMALDKLTELLKSAQIYESGYLTLISNSGLTAVDKVIENEGKIHPFWGDPSTKVEFDAAKENDCIRYI